MKPAVVAEANTIKISYSLFLNGNLEKLVTVQKTYCQQLLFEVSLFRFHFVFALQYLLCYHCKYPVKQTASFYLKLPLKSDFFSVFLLFLER